MPNIIETADAAAGTSTAYALGIGQTAQGQIGFSGDHDWYRVDLVAGQTYTFAMTGTGTNNVQDTYLKLYGTNGTTLLADNDDGLQGNNSTFTFTATTTGTHYIDAAAFSSGTGQYGISVTSGTRASFDLQMGAGVIDTDYSWSSPGMPAVVSYAFSLTDSGDEPNFSQLTAAQIAAAQSVLAMFAEVCGLSFTQVNPGGYSDNASILFSNYAANDGAGAYAYYPGDASAASRSGDVYLNTNSVSTDFLPIGGYSYYTIAHEVGHAVGLSHPGLYNAGIGQNINYATHAQFTQDTHQYTVMSYFDESNTTVSYGSFPDTLMLYDIYALQQIYGADYATHAGNTIYGFNSNAGSVYNFSINTDPALCIWDGAGTDTIDCSGYGTSQFINLNGGTFSNIGGYTGNVSIALGAVIENAVGGSGNDTIRGNGIANNLRGGAGHDSILADGTVMPTENAGAVTRLYLATLDRGPDEDGLAYYVTQLDAGASLNSIATGFINSPEFQAAYGSLNNSQFVTLLYNNVLHRAPDSGGLNYYVAQLNAGGSRENVVTSFSQSPEFQNSSNSIPNNGEVYRLYGAALNREPDAGGFINYVNALDGNVQLSTLATSFMNSPEFQAAYGSLDNSQFVTLLYNNVLHRAPDTGGLNYYTSQLDGGASRESVLLSFSESPEYQNSTAAAFHNYMRTVRPDWNDVIEGGSGNDIVSGGHGADTYIFRAGQVGTDHVYQFESWDTLQFTGYGYADKAAAISHMTQSGSNVVFVDQGQTITFHGATLADMQTADWLLQ